MKIQWKILTLSCIFIPLALAIVFFRSRDLILKNKIDYEFESSAQKAAVYKKLVDATVEPIKRNLLLLTSTAEKPAPEALQNFLAYGVLTRNPQGIWEIFWAHKNPKTEAQAWPQDFEKTLFQSLQVGEMTEQDTHFMRVSDPSGAPVLLVAQAFNKPGPDMVSSPLPSQSLQATQTPMVAVGLLAKNPLLSLFDDLRGTYLQALLVDSRGFMVSATQEDEIGQLRIEDPMIRELLRQKSLRMTGEFEKQKEKVMAFGTKVPGTNLNLALFTPKSTVTQFSQDYFRLYWIVGAGCLLLVSLISGYWAFGLAKRMSKVNDYADHLAQGEYNLQTLSMPNDEIGRLGKKLNLVRETLVTEKGKAHVALQQEAQTQKVYTNISSGLGLTLRNPLLAILGQLQLIKSKNRDDRIEPYYGAIESEAKRMKEIVDRLLRFAGNESWTPAKVSVRNVLGQIIESRREKWKNLGIQLETYLEETPAISANANQLSRALENILQNSEEALAKTEKKKLEIRLTNLEHGIRLVIQDSGEGMKAEVKRRIYDPFFSYKEGHVGLGLSYFSGVMKELSAEVQVHSQEGEGTQFFIDIPFEEKHQNLLAKELQKQENPFTFDHRLDLLPSEKGENLPLSSSAQAEKAVVVDEDQGDVSEETKQVLQELAEQALKQTASTEALADSPVDETQAIEVQDAELELEGKEESVAERSESELPPPRVAPKERIAHAISAALHQFTENEFVSPKSGEREHQVELKKLSLLDEDEDEMDAFFEKLNVHQEIDGEPRTAVEAAPRFKVRRPRVKGLKLDDTDSRT